MIMFDQWCFISLSLRRHAHGPLAERLMHMEHKSGNTSGVSKVVIGLAELYRISIL